MGSQLGTLFRVSTFGESHGVALGCVVDGCPPGVTMCQNLIQTFLDRRRPGQNEFTTQRAELDICEILSGVENEVTLGTPIAILVRNQDKKSSDYNDINQIFRPGHADYTTFKKYGTAASSGGGRASARETIGRVAAAAVAKAYVQTLLPQVDVIAWVDRIGHVQAQVDLNSVTLSNVEASSIRCPDEIAAANMMSEIKSAKNKGDSLGGVICCVAKNIPSGLGEPVFDKLEADLAKAMMSLPAARSFEIGEGWASTFLKGSENNDAYFLDKESNIITRSNRSGGIQGGISNGMPIFIRVGFKPVSTIFKQQNTVTKDFKEIQFTPTSGRHDPCVLPRAVPLIESMFWLVIADHLLRQISLNHKFLAEIQNNL
ncbi:chorismate synthase [Silvanigrella aquatica]|uniref:Chorismate synthase n=1 Tax=Silvanigrella aquatica TaxID=1915309 RepID=A0A1L4D0B9_9BACT|nr:chorismate synthase [Silvanigrella aquatica]APJ03627.1 chorismate synthase [Silvanigrella aquatica]